MLPCGRGALLAKAASFKKIPEDIQIKHEIDAKNTPKTIEKIFFLKMMRGNIEKHHQQYRQPCDLGSHFGANCLKL